MIKIGIYGYGNLGRGVLASVNIQKDMELVGIFTRRNPEDLKKQTNAPVFSVNDVCKFKDEIDVMILCGGSATDLPTQSPELVKMFNIVDSFDTHAKIYEHYNNVNEEALKSGKVGIISTGWDPGMFSLNRVIMSAVLPDGQDYTFWGKGVSQGHSDAIRRIPGVVDARQYTIPVEKALLKVRTGENPKLSTREKHLRECYVVAEEGSDKNLIEKTIKEMPNYFADYDTTVNFISMEEMKRNHSKMPHGGFVIRSGKTGFNQENKCVIEYSLKLDSNPEFTGSVLTAYARAAYKMNARGLCGCKTILDVAPIDLINAEYKELLHNNI